MRKAQGSIEYLIIIGLALVLSGVVVLLVTGGFGGQKESVQWSICRSAATQCKLVHGATPADTCDFCNESCSDPATMVPISPKAVECCRAGQQGNIYSGFNGTCTYLVNQPPVANAGPDHICYVNGVCTLDGSGSFDPDGTITQWQWSIPTGPGTGIGKLGKTVTQTFTASGTYAVNLTVIDNSGASGSDSVTISVTGLVPGPGPGPNVLN